jgi:hypothetical protein
MAAKEDAGMAWLDDVFKGGIGGTAGVIGAAVLAPVVVPAVAGIAKPVLKTLIKGGILGYAAGRDAVTGIGDFVSESVNEARAEMHAPASVDERHA